MQTKECPVLLQRLYCKEAYGTAGAATIIIEVTVTLGWKDSASRYDTVLVLYKYHDTCFSMYILYNVGTLRAMCVLYSHNVI